MRIKPTTLGIFILVVFMGTVYAFRFAGVWTTSGKVDNQGQAVQPSAEDTSSIKGWMTLEQVSTTYQIPLAELIAQFNLPADTAASTAVKDLESETFSVEGLREWLEGRTPALPTPVEEPVQPQATATPQSAVPDGGTSQGEAAQGNASADPEAHEPGERTVTGQTTFQDLLDWGLTAETIGQVIGAQMPEPATLVKDFVTQVGGSFGPVKSALQEAVDQIR